MSAILVTQVGLLVAMVGVVILFIWGPPQPGFQEGVSIEAEGYWVDELESKKAIKRRKYTWMSRVGLFLVGLGFLGQFVATIMN